MKRILAIAMAILSLCFVFAACSSSEPEGSAAKPTKAPLPEDFHIDPMTFPPEFFNTPVPEVVNEALIFAESFSHGGGGSSERTFWETYEDFDSFSKAFPAVQGRLAQVKAEDFDSMVLIAITDVVRSGGFTFGLASLEIGGGAIRIDCRKEGPSAGTMVTMAFQQNTLVVAIAKSALEPGMKTVVTVNGLPAKGEAVK